MHGGLDQYRLRSPDVIARFGSAGDATCGAFLLPRRRALGNLLVIASADAGWDHVSVSRQAAMPTYDDLTQVVQLFFEPNETVMHLWVPRSEHRNIHPFCLHLWRPQGAEIPRPPNWMV